MNQGGGREAHKQCKSCQQKYPCSSEYFDQYTRKQYEFYNDCRLCREQRLIIDRERRAKYREEHFEEVIFKEYIQSAKKRDLPFELSQDQVVDLIFSPCYYCGERVDPRVGIDRIDSSQGYILENTVSACSMCNYAKQSLTQDQFFLMCLKIVQKHNLYERFRMGDI